MREDWDSLIGPIGRMGPIGPIAVRGLGYFACMSRAKRSI
jgi:hypothetical protein